MNKADLMANFSTSRVKIKVVSWMGICEERLHFDDDGKCYSAKTHSVLRILSIDIAKILASIARISSNTGILSFFLNPPRSKI